MAAQTAKQVMIQKIREAERDSLFSDYNQLQGQIVSGTVASFVGGTATVDLGKVEGILPRGEQIPGESHRVGERVRAIVIEVRKAGPRVKIVLSRVHPDFVRRLFELEIPEISERVIEIRSLAREAGYRTKVAVSCFDQKVSTSGRAWACEGRRIPQHHGRTGRGADRHHTSGTTRCRCWCRTRCNLPKWKTSFCVRCWAA